MRHYLFVVAILVFFLCFSIPVLAAAEQFLDGQSFDFQDIFNKVSDFLKKLIDALEKAIGPFKEIIKMLGSFFIWAMELIVKLLKWGLTYLD